MIPILPRTVDRGPVRSELDGAVVVIVTEVAPEVALALRLTAGPAVQLGRLVAPEGLKVTAHASVTVPVYPLTPLTVMLEVPDAPRFKLTFDDVIEKDACPPDTEMFA